MPYTPPAQRSPASSITSSPDASRRSSLHLTPNGSRPALPRSASYLTKHRRTPSAPGSPLIQYASPSPDTTSEDLKSMAQGIVRHSPASSVYADEQSMPRGAVISPPESSSDSDDGPELRVRRVSDYKQLHDVISRMPPQAAAGSPSESDASNHLDDQPAPISYPKPTSDNLQTSFSASTLDDLATVRRIAHARSYTESNLLVPKSAASSMETSEEDSDEEGLRKPPMVRKKSGELVRPALRPPSRRRPSSMPGTPTYHKAVHFDSHLEQVRHFLQVDKPLAVSVGSSPTTEAYDSDNEFPFPGNEAGPRTPPHEWDIITNNFPADTPARMSQPVRLERIWLSTDRKSLLGSIAIMNFAFQKSVTCRFTLDYWKTTSEVACEYSCEIEPQGWQAGQDRFSFSIKLSDLANLETKTLYCALRYNVNGQEFWDNNNGINFQVDFKKKLLPQNGKRGSIGAAGRPAHSLPRSNRRVATGANIRPKPLPASLNEFGHTDKVSFDQSIDDYLGEPKLGALRLKTPSTNVPSDNLSTRLSAPSGQAFANRYDFGASLSAAMQAAKDSMPKPQSLAFRPSRKVNGLTMKPPPPTHIEIAAATKPQGQPRPVSADSASIAGATSGGPATIASSSYEELVNKYCFFGSKRSSPQMKDGTLVSQPDFVDEHTLLPLSDSADTSSTASPMVMSHMFAGQEFGLPKPTSASSYFHPAALAIPIGPSPSISPLGQSSPGSQPRTSAPRAERTASLLSSSSETETLRASSPMPASVEYQPLAGTALQDFAYAQHGHYAFAGSESRAATPISS